MGSPPSRKIHVASLTRPSRQCAKLATCADQRRRFKSEGYAGLRRSPRRAQTCYPEP